MPRPALPVPEPTPPQVLGVAGLLLALLLGVAAVTGDPGSAAASGASGVSPADPGGSAGPVAGEPGESPDPSAAPGSAGEGPAGGPATLPGGRRTVFGGERFLVAYYGSARTGALGVLGEDPPDRMHRRLVRAARPFARPGRPVQPVYELIVTVADPHPGPGRDFNHDIARADVRRYIRAAHRHGALLLLDVQPGRAGFLAVAKRWEWALRDPYVGLALDPEWRMGRHGVPGQRIGSVTHTEVNRVSAWLSGLVARHDLPEKLLVLHQFRTSMISGIDRIVRRPGLALVQHVDGFGTPGQKLDTYRAVAHPATFRMGFKLFYDEDVRRMGARAVHAVRPRVRFVSFQ
ncbi:hypothetical protein [Nocardioides sp. SYSU D00038]|uniref:hypothetical protein n=1 Tax=Nocardioides sp. SYSU D00038 TaxID=2812554 RepID=UPI001967C744|nr:hypothetical protein [Nocardioides sp. SYSU D00038]